MKRECSVGKNANKRINLWCAEPVWPWPSVKSMKAGSKRADDCHALLAHHFFHISPTEEEVCALSWFGGVFSVSGNVGDPAFPVLHQMLHDQRAPVPSQHFKSWFSQTNALRAEVRVSHRGTRTWQSSTCGRHAEFPAEGEEESSSGEGFGAFSCIYT